MVRHRILVLALAASGCSRGSEPPPAAYEEPAPIAVLGADKTDGLGVGVPRDLWVSVHMMSGGLLRSHEDAEVLAASCEADACETEVSDGKLRITPTASGRIALTLRGRTQNGTVLEATQELRVAPTQLALRFHAGVSLGATHAVMRGAELPWLSSVEEARPDMPYDFRELPSDVLPAMEVLDGDATVETKPLSGPSTVLHTIAFGAPGTVKLAVHVGHLRREISVDVLAPESAVAVEIRRLPERATLEGAFDVLDSRWLGDSPIVSTVGLGYPDESADVLVFFRDAQGRLAAGGAERASVDVGAVVTVDAAPDRMGGSLLHVVPRSLGASSVHIDIGQGGATFRAEVR
jgi:hypothetical protein